jgi:hypothetical protein
MREAAFPFRQAAAPHPQHMLRWTRLVPRGPPAPSERLYYCGWPKHQVDTEKGAGGDVVGGCNGRAGRLQLSFAGDGEGPLVLPDGRARPLAALSCL